MLRRNEELWIAIAIMLIIAFVYATVMYLTRSVPASGELFGHGLGITGFVLMLMTETLYSLRKRSRSARWGRMAQWLKFHIVTGLVGPFMVLLHTSWKFNGLAGVTTLFTIIIVISGFVGRYIYTRIPRTLDGAEIESSVSAETLKATRRLMGLWHAIHIPIGMVLFTAAFIHIGAVIYFTLSLR